MGSTNKQRQVQWTINVAIGAIHNFFVTTTVGCANRKLSEGSLKLGGSEFQHPTAPAKSQSVTPRCICLTSMDAYDMADEAA